MTLCWAARDEAVEQRRPQHALLLGQRHRQRQRGRVRVGRLQRVRVRLDEAAADEEVGDGPAQPLLVREPAEHLRPLRHRRRHLLEPEARDLLDEVDLAPDVAGAPRRHAARSSRPRPRSRGARGRRRCSSAGIGMPTTCSARSGRSRTTGRSGNGAFTSVSPDPAARRRARRGAASRRRRPARRARARRPSPSASAPPSATRSRSPLSSTPSCSKFAASSSTVVGLGRDLGLLAAHDPGDGDRPLGVGDHELLGRQLALRAVERADALARRARGGRRCGPRRASRGRTRAAGCRTRA